MAWSFMAINFGKGFGVGDFGPEKRIIFYCNFWVPGFKQIFQSFGLRFDGVRNIVKLSGIHDLKAQALSLRVRTEGVRKNNEGLERNQN